MPRCGTLLWRPLSVVPLDNFGISFSATITITGYRSMPVVVVVATFDLRKDERDILCRYIDTTDMYPERKRRVEKIKLIKLIRRNETNKLHSYHPHQLPFPM